MNFDIILTYVDAEGRNCFRLVKGIDGMLEAIIECVQEGGRLFAAYQAEKI